MNNSILCIRVIYLKNVVLAKNDYNEHMEAS